MTGAEKTHPNRPSVFWALAFIVGLAALVSYDVLRQTVHVPAALRYVSTNASAMIFTRDLAAIWGDLEDHVRPIFKQPRSDDVRNMVVMASIRTGVRWRRLLAGCSPT